MSRPATSGDPIARTETMARILNISVMHLGRLAKSGDIPNPVDRGRWDVVATANAYIAYVAGKSSSGDEVKSEELRLTIVRREKTEEERDAVRMKNEQARGELGYVADFQRAHAASLTGVRAGCLALPSRAAQRLPHLSFADIRVIDEEIRAVLTELADGIDIDPGAESTDGGAKRKKRRAASASEAAAVEMD